MSPITAPARLRQRNQLTLPDAIVIAGNLEAGTTFIVELEPSDPDVVRLRRVRTSYAGALRGLYGPADEYVEGERAGWE
jgi:hypothetical protein